MTNRSTVIFSKSYVFDPRPRLPFRIVANRYWTGECPDTTSKTKEDALTLVFLPGHCAHKEQWEPTIRRLFQNQQVAPRRTVRFHDMWSLDLPNQGDSAVLNEEVLQCGYDTVYSWEHHARVVHAFLAGLGTGVDVDFSRRRLVLLGHSMGGPVCMLTVTYYPLLKISSLYLVEPFLAGDNVQTLFSPLSETSDRRRDIWPSTQDAFRALKRQSSMCTWDDRILKIFVEHGLRPLPTAEYPDLKEGVTLKCRRKQEAAVYRDYVTPVIGFRFLPHVLKEIPTHITLGTASDYISEGLQEDMLHVASGGISNFASITWVPGAGHMMLQTHPDALGDTIWKRLMQSYEWSHRDIVVAKL